MGTILIENRRVEYEGVSIYIDKIEIEMLVKMNEDFCPLTHVTQSALFHHTTEDKTLVGDVHVFFRSQGEDKSFGMLVAFKLSAKGAKTYLEAEIFTIVVQYIFKWTIEYIKENNIVDTLQSPFIVPEFLYSKSYFDISFPD